MGDYSFSFCYPELSPTRPARSFEQDDFIRAPLELYGIGRGVEASLVQLALRTSLSHARFNKQSDCMNI